ncbi:MAG: hypothetical protein R3293_07230 [Candidatus Promineifilaceae bacterium]|nr:hypothetical protein [Candidatus Promineifilaceae bacterium]
MQINFFDDPAQQPKSREDVRIKQIGIFVHEDGRKISFGLELTPFLERPSIQVDISNGLDEPAGALTVIESMTPNFSLIIHLRDEELSDPYELLAIIYYATPETDPVKVDSQRVSFAAAVPGEKIYSF